ncbi:hypothetical protein THIOSC15_1780004 [uncultured Thiomicrorhabdus sp.]
MKLHSNTFTYSKSLTIQGGASVYLGETGSGRVNVLFIALMAR